MNASARIENARAIPIESEIARRGIKLKGTVDRCGPCPRCGGTDRFSVNTRKQCWNCRGCALGGDVIALVQHLDGCSFTAAIETLTGELRPIRGFAARAVPPPAKTDEEYERQQHAKATSLWSQRRPITGSIAEQYLREARHYTGPLPSTLAFLPARYEYPPAMIATYAMPDEPEPGILGEPHNVVAVHITRLVPDGSDRERGKRAKITIGRPLGRPIVLAPPNDLLGLVIAEGIEDALSAHEATGLGAWAAGSASFMPALAETIPSYIESLTILVDDNPAGWKGSTALRGRLLARRGRLEIQLIRSAPDGL
jgi:hypothetical protein